LRWARYLLPYRRKEYLLLTERNMLSGQEEKERGLLSSEPPRLLSNPLRLSLLQAGEEMLPEGLLLQG
jgi:hypothetical protein